MVVKSRGGKVNPSQEVAATETTENEKMHTSFASGRSATAH